MELLHDVVVDGMTPSELWNRLDAPTRRSAVEAMFEDRAARREAEEAIAGAMRFRVVAVRKLPVEKRIDYLLRSVHPDDNLASSLLMSLHVQRRKPLLATFLDEMGISHEDGVIDDDEDFAPADTERIGRAVDRLYETSARDEADVYLATLVTLDPESWEGLADVLHARIHDKGCDPLTV